MMIDLADAHEKRDAATAGIPGVCLNAIIAGFELLKMIDEKIDALLNIELVHLSYVENRKGKRVLHLILIKSLHSFVKSALFWCYGFSSTLESLGFELHPDDLCAANSTINGPQCAA